MKSQRLPRRGKALGELAAAFLLNGKTSRLAGGVPGPTRKRVLGDSSEVSDGAFQAVAKELVEGLFTDAYLESLRFRDDDELREHNALVLDALTAALERWGTAAALANLAGPEGAPPQLGPLLLTRIDGDLLIRAAAYDALYGARHPVRDEVGLFPRKSSAVKEWWARFCQCHPRTLRIADLHKLTGVRKPTLEGLARGEVRTEWTLQKLAEGLSRLSVRDAQDRPFSGPRIEFELRLAAGFDALGLPRFFADPLVAGAWARVRERLDDLPRDIVVDLLRKGASSAFHDRLAPAMVAHALQSVAAIVQREQQRAANIERLYHEGRPKEAARLYAEDVRAQARELRDDELTRPQADFLEWDARTMLAMADGAAELPVMPPNLRKEREAVGHVMSVLAPWVADKPPAEDTLRKAVELAPHMREPRRLLIGELSGAGRVDEAIEAARDLHHTFPDDPSVHETLVELLVTAVRPLEVVELTEQSLSLSARLRACRGVALLELARADEALAELDAALTLDPDDLFAIAGKAQYLRARGRHADAAVLERRASALTAGGLERALTTLFGRASETP